MSGSPAERDSSAPIWRVADLSDGNDLRSWIVAPRRAMVRREDWNLDLGLRGRVLRFDLDLRLGLFGDWMLRLRAAHSVNDRSRLSPGTGDFDATSFTVALTRRF